MEIIFRISVAIIYFAQFIGIIYFNKKSSVKNVAIDKRESLILIFFRSLWVVAIVFSIIIYVSYPKLIQFASVDFTNSIRICGIVFGFIVDVLLFWVLFSLDKNISTTLSLGDNHVLVKKGPYKYVRHPMYALGIFLFTSIMLISSNVLIGFSGIAFQLFVMVFRTPNEEKMLEEHFGPEFIDYKATTGMFFPKII